MFGRIKNLFKAPSADDNKRVVLPAIVQAGVNPADEWEIVGELGDGAFGKVEKAVLRADPRRVAAAKCITIEEGEELEDFLVEIHILTACSHPNVVGLYACFYYEHKLSMMLEYCGGGAVDGIMIELEKPLTEPQIAYVAKYTCEALAYLHDQNVIHRDLKAGNILLTGDAIVKLADFGVSAKMRDKAEKRDTFIGTPYWMAPEVMACETFKDQPYDTRSDIWSFGITLIELAQMEPPHAEVSPMRVLIKVQKSDPPKLDRPDQWSLFFNDFLSQCLIKQPMNRRTATQLRSHPFLRSGTDKRSVEALLAEVSADVREEEVIVEDDQSVADSEDLQSEEAAQENVPPTAPVSITVDDKRQKRAAPPPPVSPVHSEPVIDAATPIAEQNVRSTERTPRAAYNNASAAVSPVMLKSPKSPAQSDVADVLRELDTALSSEATFITISPDSMHSGSAHSSAAFSPQQRRQEMIEASKTISNVLDTVRARSQERQMQSPEQRSDTALSTDSDSGLGHDAKPAVVHSCETYIELEAEEEEDGAEHVHHIALHDTDSLSTTGVSALRERFESPQRKASYGSPRTSRASSTSRQQSLEETDPESMARARIRNAIQQQINLEATRQSASAHATRPIISTASASSVVKATVVRIEDREPVSSSEFSPARLHDRTSSGTPPSTPTKLEVARKASNEVKRTPSKKEYAYFEEIENVETPDYAATQEYFGDVSSDFARPPPDPPVDYEEQRERDRRRTATSASSTLSKDSSNPPEPTKVAPGTEGVKMRNSNASSKDDRPVRRHPYRQTVTKKTRTYVVDGVEVTSTTMHVLGRQQNLQIRRQEMQELKRVQREESRQIQELDQQATHQNELQERKQMQEKMGMIRQYEIDMDALMRKQKREIEDAERLQEEELRTTSKRLKYEQEKDLQAFRERMKQEMKIIKQEVEMLPRAQRKEALKQRKEMAEESNALKERDFMMQLRMNAEASIARMRGKHKEKIAQLERQFLEQKHMLLRAKEGSEWELEEKVMSERYVLHRRLLKDKFYLLRTQMLARQQKELQQAQKLHAREEEELIRALTADRKRLPKMLRSEAKTRSAMYKESLRISMATENATGDINDLVRRFEEAEKARITHALKEHELKSEKKISALKEKNVAEMKELEEAQNDNRKLLLEKERQTLQEHENKYILTRDEWKADLPRKKLELETLFDQELSEQEHFYGMQTSTPSTPSLGRV